MQSCAELVRQIAPPLAAELNSIQNKVNAHCETIMRKGLTTDNSTSAEDCLMLYALARHFGCKQGFEVGAYIGTTAIAINDAIRRNGGVFTTCDPINYNAIPPWDGIRFIHAGSSIALRILYEEESTLDFVFLDWVPDKWTLELLPKTCNGEAIIAVHDFTPNNPKGAEAVHALRAEFGGHRSGTWFVPDEKPCDTGHGIKLNANTAFFIPSHLYNGMVQ